jgi:hypothetical protein
MHQNLNFSENEVPLSQLGRNLSAREEAADGLIVEVGMRPVRRLTPSSQCRLRVAQTSVLYVWPEPSRHHPFPRNPAQPQ